MIYCGPMPDRNDNLLDKAEKVVRRVFERIGDALDRKVRPGDQASLSARAAGDLIGRIEHAIESALQPDKAGTRRVAPNSVKVLLTYEGTAEISDPYLETLADELRTATEEYIRNRRYEIGGDFHLEVRRDLFAKSVTIQTDFDSSDSAPLTEASGSSRSGQTSKSPLKRIVRLSIGGSEHVLNLIVGESPKSIGRAGGNALRIEDSSVSRVHCSFALRASGEVVVSDLGSANGTSVGGGLLASGEAKGVRPGDIVLIGDVELMVKGVDEES